jgi:hypothetical protein
VYLPHLKDCKNPPDNNMAPRPSLAKHINFSHIGNQVLVGGFALWDWKSRVNSGTNPISAAAGVGLDQIPFLIAGNSLLGGMALSIGFAGAKALGASAIGASRSLNQWSRSAGQPFSHRFEHSQASYMAMQQGLTSMNISRGAIGNEAGLFAARYGRR